MLADQMPDLVVREQDIGGESALVATIRPEVVNRDQDTTVQQNIQTLRNRVTGLGVAEPIVKQQGLDRIVVQLAGVQDSARAKEILGRTASLEVRIVSEEQMSGPGRDAFSQYRDQPAPFGTDKFLDIEGNPVLVRKNVVITGDRIRDAQPNFDQRNGGSAGVVWTDRKCGRSLRHVTPRELTKH